MSDDKKIYRQGDVLIRRIDELPAQKLTKRESGILAYGEVTGHAHRIKQAAKPSARIFDFGAERFIQVLEKIALTHEEHGAIFLDAGVYRQAFQFEEKRAEIQRVVD